jgi:hypothetical protein
MMIVQIIQEDPPSPRKLQTRIPRDLETICLKCLRKEPERRYETAKELAADLRRWLSDEPIQARPAGTWERLWRWSGKNMAPLAGFYAIAESLVNGPQLLTTLSGTTNTRLPSDLACMVSLIPVIVVPILCGIYTFKGHRLAVLLAVAWYSSWSLLHLATIAVIKERGIDAITEYGLLVAALIGFVLFDRVLFVGNVVDAEPWSPSENAKNVLLTLAAVFLAGPFLILAIMVYGAVTFKFLVATP